MDLLTRTNAFISLGTRIANLKGTEKSAIAIEAGQHNGWFTQASVESALQALSLMLSEQKLLQWVGRYSFANPSRTVGIAMAGNIPLVGFHDLLCVLISGHKAIIKTSAQDSYLIDLLLQWLIELEPRFQNFVLKAERLNGVEATIATGSDNTSRYFEYYFRKIPHIIRKNRSSCAMLMGEEPAAELEKLGHDVFTYFGLGCRNVAKLFVPADYDFRLLLESWSPFRDVINHHKYANNYDYQKSIMLVNQTPFFDNEFVLLTENQNLVSPISVLFYEHYKSQQNLKEKIDGHQSKLQCCVSANGWFTGSIPFGKAQQPELWDYADNIDTLKFLTSL
ncbi:MAG: acyl-CoA reductase [Cytophagales bacterium]|nr:acyl-CoA reductase [Cytophagales bacterium]